MRSWTLPLSNWPWASAAVCMGMDLCARRPEAALGKQANRLIESTGSAFRGGL